MAGPVGTLIGQGVKDLGASCGHAFAIIKSRGPSQFQFWFIALAIGIAAGFAALFFRLGINALQGFLYGTDDLAHLHSFVTSLAWYQILLLPIVGGLLVGLILHHFTDDGRVRSVSDVIEGAALNEGRVTVRQGLASALASLITLSTGGSSGREGPVVHLSAVLSTIVSRWLRANGITGRDLLGCAVAAGVSASFNAPLAGALFALEVVLRHFAVHAFAPIVIASVAGTVINRLAFGDVTEFVLPVQKRVGVLRGIARVSNPWLDLRAGVRRADARNFLGRGYGHRLASRYRHPALSAPCDCGRDVGRLGDFLAPYHRGRI